MSKVSVGILTHNRRDKVLRCLKSVFDQGMEDIEIVVVDSASTDGTQDAIQENYPSVKFIRLPRNCGCPGGRNHIFVNCTGDYIVNVDDDGFLGEGVLQGVLTAFDSDPTIGIIAMHQLFTDQPGEGRIAGEGRQEVSDFSGGVCAFRRSMLDKIGDYPHDFFLYAEEAYLAIRAIDAGYRIVSNPSLIIWHPRIGVSGLSAKKWDYYLFRNPLLVVLRLFPGWMMLQYLILRAGSYALISARRGTFHKYIAAIISVIYQLPGTLMTRKACKKETIQTYFRLRG
ncbi:MAG: glycosyltransferase family 2 protein [bacterium]